MKKKLEDFTPEVQEYLDILENRIELLAMIVKEGRNKK